MQALHVILFLLFNSLTINAKDAQSDVPTAAVANRTLQQRSESSDFNAKTENLTKRNAKETDLLLSSSSANSAKNYDPPPEYYRGSATTGHLTTTQDPFYYNNNNYKPYNGFKSKPIAFPDTYSTSSSINNNNKNNYNAQNRAGAGGAGGAGAGNGVDANGGTKSNHDVHAASSYNSWQHIKGKVGTLLNKKDALQDRISVGHYGSTSEYGVSTNGRGGSYAYEGRPYGGQAQHVDYGATNSHFSSSVAPSAHTSGYYGGGSAAEGIPFDLYGNKNHYSDLAGHDYGTYPYSDIQEPAAHKTHADFKQKALLAKSFLIPLASAAVLGIAAALVSNPFLLQLGTVSGIHPGAAVLGKRKRRDLTTSAIPPVSSTNSLDFTSSSVQQNKKDANMLPYRGHHQRNHHQENKHH